MKPRYGHGRPAHSGLCEIVDANRNLYEEFLYTSLEFKENIQTIKKDNEVSNANNPIWNNGFLPGLDITGIYAMLAIYKPEKYIEIGSGNSTKVAYKSRTENKLTTEIISIDPNP